MIWLIFIMMVAFLQMTISRRNGERMKAAIGLTIGCAAYLIAFHRSMTSAVGYVVIAVFYVLVLWNIGTLKKSSQTPLHRT